MISNAQGRASPPNVWWAPVGKGKALRNERSREMLWKAGLRALAARS